MRYSHWAAGRRVLLVIAALTITLLGAASTARATFPGSNGMIVYSDLVDRENNNRIALVDPSTGSSTFLTDTCCEGLHDDYPQWSPDGNRIAFASNRSGNWELYAMDPDGGSLTQLTSTPTVDEIYPAWSADGRHIAFATRNLGPTPESDIYVMDADGTGTRPLLVGPGFDGDPEWSPDGSRIVFTSNRDGARDLYTMTPAATDVRRVTFTGGARAASWSPDGTRFIFHDGTPQDDGLDCGVEALFVVDVDGTDRHRFNCLPSWSVVPAWSPQGDMVAYSSDYDLVLALADGTGRRVTGGFADGGYADWQPLVAPRNDARPSISGARVVGSVLVANAGMWWGTGPVTHRYTWLRCNRSSRRCAAVKGATGARYRTTSRDKGHTLRVKVSATNRVGGDAVVSAATGRIAKR